MVIILLFIWLGIQLTFAILYKCSSTVRRVVKENLINKIELSDYLETKFPNTYLIQTAVPVILLILAILC